MPPICGLCMFGCGWRFGPGPGPGPGPFGPIIGGAGGGGGKSPIGPTKGVKKKVDRRLQNQCGKKLLRARMGREYLDRNKGCPGKKVQSKLSSRKQKVRMTHLDLGTAVDDKGE